MGKGRWAVDRIIFHCDLNCFYASAELLDHPELRHLPVAVCGDPESRHGIILAKNEPAKGFGVKTAETIWQARKKCPELVLLPAHHDKYRRLSRQVGEIYREYTDLVEPFGIDESWLDLTGSLHLFGGDAVALADGLRDRLRRELGLTISVGVSFNKVFAKLGSDYKKPDATTVITRENFRQIVWPLPVSDLLYVGRAATETFQRFGVKTIGDLAAFDRQALFTLLGKHGVQLHDYACGLDRSPVSPAAQQAPPKSVGNGFTFPRNLQGREDIRGGVTQLSDHVAARLRLCGMKCQGVSLAIRDPDFHDISRQMRLDTPTCLGRELAQAAMALADSAGPWTARCGLSPSQPSISSRRRRPPPSWSCGPSPSSKNGRAGSGWSRPWTPSGPNTAGRPSSPPLPPWTPPPPATTPSPGNRDILEAAAA